MLTLSRQNAYRDRYRALRPGWRPATEVYADLARGYAHAGARVLDAGCGRGGLSETLAGAVALAAGADPDHTSLVEHRAPSLRRARALLERLPYAGGAFDLVVCSWVLEHLADPGAALREIARVLAPGGRLVCLTPNARHPVVLANRALMGSWQRRLVRAFYGRAEADTFPARYRANTPSALARLAAGAGLQVVAVQCIEDPTYLAFNAPLFRLSVAFERALPRGLRVHLVGEFRKPG
jgi:ubiquinone/menaquinone biosynthesis C-methylase UbiE